MSRLPILVSLALGVLVWWLTAIEVGPLLLPTPGEVGAALVEARAQLVEGAVQTAVAALAGLFGAFALGVGAAAAAWRSRVLGQALLPWTLFLQVVPIVAIAPLLVVWLGYGRGVSVATAGIAAFYPVYAATGTGLRAPGSDLVDLLRLYGARPFQELLLLRIPAALPALFSGLRTAAGLSVIGAIVGEFVGSNGSPPTLGFLVLFSARSADTARCFAAILLASVLALLFHGALRFVERRAIGHWYGTAE